MRPAINPIVLALRGAIWLYRMLISPLLGANCRYEPSCSVYAGQALERFGLWRGSFLAVKRLGSCHPWGGSGFDPVPAQHRADPHMCCGRDPEFRSP